MTFLLHTIRNCPAPYKQLILDLDRESARGEFADEARCEALEEHEERAREESVKKARCRARKQLKAGGWRAARVKRRAAEHT